ncbi:unnamed protein product [Ceutorhynchus assimilis]|uniref:Uncharacterized protein n=1 Tax=Ceutorhynchus assimilis TaxID=467358 RepID=A0A9P0DIF7_9CUCU|nr:unnamed protein product [Ceutorhynchus assimilis]
MTRWAQPPRQPPPDPPDPSAVTDDPLAALGLSTSRIKGARSKGQVYAVNRINPLFNPEFPTRPRSPPSGCETTTHPLSDRQVKTKKRRNHSDFSPQREKTPEIDYDDESPTSSSDYKFRETSLVSGDSRKVSLQSRMKSVSSGYGGSSLDNDRLQLVEEAGAVLEHNPAFVRSIRIAGRGLKTTKSVPSQHSSSSAGGTLTTIPEGRVDLPVPQPIWPGPLDHRGLVNNYNYDSLVDEALLLYTSLNNHNQLSDSHAKLDQYLDISVKDLLLDLLASINQTLEGKTGTPEEMLKIINDKIKLKLEALKNNTEEEMRKLCINLSNSRKMNSVLRAFSQSSSSGHSSSSGRVVSSSNDEDIYHIPSGSSSSGFSDSPPGHRRPTTPLLPHLYGRKPSILPPFCCDHDASTLSRGIRNALIYGTLCRQKMTTSLDQKPIDFKKPNDQVAATSENCDKITSKDAAENNSVRSKQNCLTNSFNCDKVKGGSVPRGQRDERPSVWQLYYGMKAEGTKRYGEGKPTDVPVFPGGRPEADFTLDVPRSELLSKRLREDKKWRFRCRVLTSFLGLVFFLLSVMAVSLILTRGKRMFGSMM